MAVKTPAQIAAEEEKKRKRESLKRTQAALKKPKQVALAETGVDAIGAERKLVQGEKLSRTGKVIPLGFSEDAQGNPFNPRGAASGFVRTGIETKSQRLEKERLDLAQKKAVEAGQDPSLIESPTQTRERERAELEERIKLQSEAGERAFAQTAERIEGVRGATAVAASRPIGAAGSFSLGQLPTTVGKELTRQVAANNARFSANLRNVKSLKRELAKATVSEKFRKKLNQTVARIEAENVELQKDIQEGTEKAELGVRSVQDQIDAAQDSFFTQVETIGDSFGGLDDIAVENMIEGTDLTLSFGLALRDAQKEAKEAREKNDIIAIDTAKAKLAKLQQEAKGVILDKRTADERNFTFFQKLKETDPDSADEFAILTGITKAETAKERAQRKEIEARTEKIKKASQGETATLNIVPTGQLTTREFAGRPVTLDSGAMEAFQLANNELRSIGLDEIKIGAIETSSTRSQEDTIQRMAERFGIAFNSTDPNVTAEQLRQMGHQVADVGSSKHEQGLAIDVFPDRGEIDRVKTILSKNGWTQPLPDADAGHFIFTGLANTSSRPQPKFKNVDQGNAWGFGNRTLRSNDIINELEGVDFENPTDDFLIEAGGFGLPSIPFLGGAGSLIPNKFLSAKEQKFQQAKRDFTNAQLRRESGAAISSSEFENADEQYFPQPGDTKEVLAQKRNNREVVIQNLFEASGNSNIRPQVEAQVVSDRIISERQDKKSQIEKARKAAINGEVVSPPTLEDISALRK